MHRSFYLEVSEICQMCQLTVDIFFSYFLRLFFRSTDFLFGVKFVILKNGFFFLQFHRRV